jgi:enamine deaminase RidA (YjgF/YER057c/UK114 family)
MDIEYPRVPTLSQSPAYSAVAVIPAGGTLVVVGGQNAVNQQGELVGRDDLALQARQVHANVEAALATAGCTFDHVFRVTVYLKAGVDARTAYQAFASALAGRAAPPIVGAYFVSALARPEFLIEVGVEAMR